MNSGSGIQELMAAETRASQIVADARLGKREVVKRNIYSPQSTAAVLFASLPHFFPFPLPYDNPTSKSNFIIRDVTSCSTWRPHETGKG
mmetsp:Transcript_27636/g.36712  ORF Transcript_27636/g.36712 Transcript_27636/m.36712 type:complete len:89 (-) Transcript_27636:3007-3273(-)